MSDKTPVHLRKLDNGNVELHFDLDGERELDFEIDQVDFDDLVTFLTTKSAMNLNIEVYEV